MAARVLSSRSGSNGSPTVSTVPEPIVYLAQDRPDVEVLWEGVWCPGEMRMQRQDSSGQWLCNVQYRRPGELSSHIDTFRSSEVRRDAKGDSILRDEPVRGTIDNTHLDSTTRLD